MAESEPLDFVTVWRGDIGGQEWGVVMWSDATFLAACLTSPGSRFTGSSVEDFADAPEEVRAAVDVAIRHGRMAGNGLWTPARHPWRGAGELSAEAWAISTTSSSVQCALRGDVHVVASHGGVYVTTEQRGGRRSRAYSLADAEADAIVDVTPGLAAELVRRKKAQA